MKLKLYLLWFIACLSLSTTAQPSLYKKYIDQYADMAVHQMKKYGIPASITLAQGLLESGAGTSRLAREGNNHFGIKCGGRWNGPYMLVTDDAPNEKFRVYKNAKESYEDHSKFLKNGRRYAFLFDLRLTDYKGWARGLKKAGYATNPRYAISLIEVIERYDLHEYDKGKHRHHKGEKHKQAKKRKERFNRPIYRCNGQYYLVVHAGDSYTSLARMLKEKEEKLREYNDALPGQYLHPGDVVYLGKKQKKAAKELKRNYHIMEAGETLHAISQRYGIRLGSLCKMNPIKGNRIFKEGDRIRIR